MKTTHKVLTISGDSKPQDSLEIEEIWVHEFDEASSKKFREAILKQASVIDDVNRPIVVYIDSYGGIVDSLAAMIETIDSMPNPIITACMGKAMSCGAILLSHGDIRFCGQHSRVMVHEVSGGSQGDVHDFLNNAKEGNRLNKYFMGLLAKNCGVEGGYNGLRKIFKEHDGRELWMGAKAALKFGIIDNVGIPVIESETTYEATVFKKEL